MSNGSISVLVLAIVAAIWTAIYASKPPKSSDTKFQVILAVILTVFLWLIFALMQIFPGVVGSAYE